MKNKKLKLILVVFAICLFTPLPLVYGYESAWSILSTHSSYYNFPDYNENTGEGLKLSGNNGYFTRALFYITNSGAPSGTLRCALINATSTNDGLVNATELSTNTIDVSSVSGVTEIQFTFSETKIVQSGNNWIVLLYWYGGAGANVQISRDTSAGATGKITVHYPGGVYTGSASNQGPRHQFFTENTAPTPSSAPPTTYYHYSIAPSPNYTIWNYITSAQMVQATHYVYTGTIISNSTPYGSGTYAVYKTPLYYNGSVMLLNATNALGLTGTLVENLSQNLTGTFSLNGEGTFSFSIDPQYIDGSWKTYQGYKVNGTITSTGETFTSYIVIEASEPTIVYVGSMTGGHFGSNWAGVATAPTEVYLNQRSSYSYRGEIYVANNRNGTGNFTTYSTGLSSLSTIWTTGTFSEVATGNITNGLFTFNFASRESTGTSYEAYRVFVLLDDGRNYTANYFFSWRQNVWTTPASSGLIPSDSSGLSGSILAIVSFLVLFLLIGVPAFLLGVKAGLPGLIVGAILGLGIGVLAGLVPFWFIFLVGLGTVTALLMWRKNNGQG